MVTGSNRCANSGRKSPKTRRSLLHLSNESGFRCRAPRIEGHSKSHRRPGIADFIFQVREIPAAVLSPELCSFMFENLIQNHDERSAFFVKPISLSNLSIAAPVSIVRWARRNPSCRVFAFRPATNAGAAFKHTMSRLGPFRPRSMSRVIAALSSGPPPTKSFWIDPLQAKFRRIDQIT